MVRARFPRGTACILFLFLFVCSLYRVARIKPAGLGFCLRGRQCNGSVAGANSFSSFFCAPLTLLRVRSRVSFAPLLFVWQLPELAIRPELRHGLAPISLEEYKDVLVRLADLAPSLELPPGTNRQRAERRHKDALVPFMPSPAARIFWLVSSSSSTGRFPATQVKRPVLLGAAFISSDSSDMVTDSGCNGFVAVYCGGTL